MKTSIQVLKRRLVSVEEDRNGLLFDNVVHEIDRMNKLVSELLDFAKPHHPDLKRLSLTQVVQRSLSLIVPSAEAQGVRLVFEPEGADVEILADENQTEQIILNVLTNAINASSAEDAIKLRVISHQGMGAGADIGTGTGAGEVEAAGLGIGGGTGRIAGRSMVYMVVEDEGRGIAASDLEKVFDPFFTTHATGTGLGLPVVQKLMTDMGGEIELISEEGVGTTVILKFPAAQREEALG
jgi:signal transduction histidine kinase